MAVSEDAAMVLEQFVQDVANLPAEIAHLLEEIQAKDKIIQECRSIITTRDNSIQKHIRMNGSLAPNPKEDVYNKAILMNFERAQQQQEEKVALSEKAALLLDRHIRRLDLKIRDLQLEGTMPSDPPLPSLLHASPANRTPISNTPATNASTPLNTLQPNVVPSTTIANSEILRLAQPQPTSQRPGTATTGSQQLHRPLIGVTHNSNSAPATPAASAILHQRQRESSAGATNEAKRRRLNGHLGTLPAASSNLARTSSLGPGTPKPGTPGAATAVRGGSAGPRTGIKKTAAVRKVAPHQQIRKKLGKPGPPNKKASKKQASPSSVGEEESILSEGGSPPASDEEKPTGTAAAAKGTRRAGTGKPSEDTEMVDASAAVPAAAAGGKGGAGAEAEAEDEEGGDDRKYCTCRNVSYGDMVACDNDECPYEWFHWQCVGMTKEPAGTWYCDECRTKMAA